MMTNHELRYSPTAVNNVRKAVEDMACKCDPHGGGGGGGDNTALCALIIDDKYELARVSNEFLDTYVLNQYSANTDKSLYGSGLPSPYICILNTEAYGAFSKFVLTEGDEFFDFTDVTFTGIPLDDITKDGVMTKFNLVLNNVELDSYGVVVLYHLSGTIEIIRGANLYR